MKKSFEGKCFIGHTLPPSDGVSIFTRISEANSTVVGNYYGKIIIPPGGSVISYLYSSECQHLNAEIAFGWWEGRTYSCPYYDRAHS